MMVTCWMVHVAPRVLGPMPSIVTIWLVVLLMSIMIREPVFSVGVDRPGAMTVRVATIPVRLSITYVDRTTAARHATVRSASAHIGTTLVAIVDATAASTLLTGRPPLFAGTRVLRPGAIVPPDDTRLLPGTAALNILAASPVGSHRTVSASAICPLHGLGLTSRLPSLGGAFLTSRLPALHRLILATSLFSLHRLALAS